MAFNFDSIKKVVSQLGDERKKAESQLEKLKRQREDLASAGVSKKDLISGFSAWIDSEAKAYRERLALRMKTFANRPSDAQAIGTMSHPFKPGLFQLDRDGVPGREGFQIGALAMLFAPALKKAIGDEIAAMDMESEGLPASERAKQVEALDNQIEAIEAELLALRKTAQQSGVILK